MSVQIGILQSPDALRRDAGMGCLFVSHDLQVVQRGREVESGPALQVLDCPSHSCARRPADAASAFPLPSAAPAGAIPSPPGPP